MTIPILPIPETRPGFASQTPGDGGALGAGLQSVLQALLAGRQLNQGQQGLDLEQQRLDAFQQDADARRQLQLMQFLANQAEAAGIRQDQTTIGQAIQSLEPVNTEIPGIGGMTAPPVPLTIPGKSVAEATQALPPRLVSEFQKQGKTAIESRQARDQERVRQRVQKQTLAALPESLRPALQAAFQVQEGSGNKELANDVFAAVSSALPPDQVAAIDEAFPDFKMLPTDQKLKAVAALTQAQVELKLGIGQESARQAQSRLADARRQAVLLANQAKGKTPEALRAALALIGVINDEVDAFNFLVANPDLIRATKTERVARAFPSPVVQRAYQQAIENLAASQPNLQVSPGPFTQPPGTPPPDSTLNLGSFLNQFGGGNR